MNKSFGIFNNTQKSRRRHLLTFMVPSLLVLIAYFILFQYHRKNVQEIYDTHKRELRDQYLITLNIYQEMSETVFTLLINTEEIRKKADRNLYTAKEQGRNRIISQEDPV